MNPPWQVQGPQPPMAHTDPQSPMAMSSSELPWSLMATSDPPCPSPTPSLSLPLLQIHNFMSFSYNCSVAHHTPIPENMMT